MVDCCQAKCAAYLETCVCQVAEKCDAFLLIKETLEALLCCSSSSLLHSTQRQQLPGVSTLSGPQ